MISSFVHLRSLSADILYLDLLLDVISQNSIMADVSIRDVFLSMQLPPVDEIVATSKTGDYCRLYILLVYISLFRISNYSEISSFMLPIMYVCLQMTFDDTFVLFVDHVPKAEETTDTSNNLLDELIEIIHAKNEHLKEHLHQEDQAIEDLLCKKFVFLF